MHPQLGPQQGLTVRITEAVDGSIVDRDDNQLVNPVPVYSVLALKDQITDIAGHRRRVGRDARPRSTPR